MTRTTSSSLSRWARWGLLVSTVAMGGALVSTAWSSQRRVEEASELLLVGQAQSLLRTLGERLRYGSEPNAEELASFVEENAELGVRYVGVHTFEGLQQAGTSAEPPPSNVREPRGAPYEMARVGDRVRVIGRIPPHRPPRHSDGFSRRTERRRGGPGPRFGHMIVEFEPVVGNRLQNDARRAFIVSSAVAAAFLLVTAALWRMLLLRERAEARAEQERRLAMLGEMSAVLAHEIRNPLASLKGHAQLLAEQLEAGTAPRRKADRVVQEAVRIETLSRSLLDFVRSGSITPERVSPAELVAKSAESIAGRFDIDSTNAPQSWMLDPVRMQQVFTNLLENAVASKSEELVSVRIAEERGRLVVSVRDRGPGIARGEEERIFEAFHSTRTKGVGLGLAVARRIVELHGGSIRALNHPEGGALFELTIPGDEARG